MEAQIEFHHLEEKRFFLPYQPKTRLGKYADNTSCILSKEIPGLQLLTAIPTEQLNRELNDGTIQHYARSAFHARLRKDLDYKDGNVGIDHESRVIGFDGEQGYGDYLYPQGCDYHLNSSIRFITKKLVNKHEPQQAISTSQSRGLPPVASLAK